MGLLKTLGSWHRAARARNLRGAGGTEGDGSFRVSAPESGTAVCRNCGADNPEGSRFCGSCGAAIAAIEQCPNCGAENPAGQSFCNSCGSRLATPAEAP